ncbi:DUF2946 family protein [Hydrogenophaga sp. NFH-34]|uniref:DUF2946 family protein n=1 Tax=Hydrogenophaga sp. NFH-34 TaxID=2744446 RepID=UPI001F2CA94F|nr:DUF2946 family protein [Hydrogenophaga sp. NFH-34]
MTLSRLSVTARGLTRWVLAMMLLASLAPAFSRALGAGGGPPGAAAPGSGWVEICGPGGIRWVQVDVASAQAQAAEPAREQPAAGLHAGALDHCALCGLSLDRCLPDETPTLGLPAGLLMRLSRAPPAEPVIPAPTGPLPARGPPA